MFKPSTLLQCVTEQNIGLPGSKKYDPNKLSVSISSKWLMIVRGSLNSIITEGKAYPQACHMSKLYS